MAVRFILGRSGTGKTRYCLAQIVRALQAGGDEPLVLLVPEQATYQAERAILSWGPIRAYSRLHVLSFSRLAFLVLKDHRARPELSAAGRRILVARLLHRVAERLEVFGRVKGPGWAGSLASVIEQLQREAVEPDALRQTAEALARAGAASTTVGKFRDLACMLEAYVHDLHTTQRGWIDAAAELETLVAALRRATFLDRMRLWIDGFSGFTGQEQAVLAELLSMARQVRVALCLDPEAIDVDDPVAVEPGAARPFAVAERTYVRLRQIAAKRKVPVESPIVLRRVRRFREAVGLARVEAAMLRDPGPSTGRPDTAGTSPDTAESSVPMRVDGAVEVVKAHDVRAEARYVAGRIVDEVRNGRCRWRDIAVIVSDMEGYRHVLEPAFDDAGIPYFIDRPRPLHEHVLSRTLMTCLRLATGGPTSEEMAAFLKSPFSPLGVSEADAVEQYVRAFGVQGDEWLQEAPWQWARTEAALFDEARVDAWRRSGVAPIRRLIGVLGTDTTGGTCSGRTFIDALEQLLSDLDAARRVAALAESSPAHALVHRQAYEKTLELLGQYAAIMETVKLLAIEHVALLAQGLETLYLKQIPPTLDAVLVGAIERSRHPDIRVAFVIGATQGQFPVPVGTDAVLTDAERAAAERCGLELGDRMTRRLLDRAYLAYIAFTRPSNKLVITRPTTDAASRPVVGSPFVRELVERFEDLRETTVEPRNDLRRATCTAELAERLCLALGADGGSETEITEAAVLLDTLARGPEPFGSMADRVRAAVAYRNDARLPTDLVRAIYEGPLHCSVSRLSRFASCPYQHFARHVLRLEPRRVLTFEAVDTGMLYHRVLQRLFHRLQSDKPPRTWADLEPEAGQIEPLVCEVMEAVVSADAGWASLVGRSPQIRFVIQRAAEVMTDFVVRLVQMAHAGRLRQIASECVFGQADGERDMPPVHLTDGALDLYLHGRLDRIDCVHIGDAGDQGGAAHQSTTSENDQPTAVVVFDYKRRDARFDWAAFAAGLDLQLPGYLLAVENAGCGWRPVGAFLLPIEPASSHLKAVKNAVGYTLDSPKATGVFNGEWAEFLDATAVSTRRGSAFYSFTVKKDGDRYGNWGRSSALRPHEFARLIEVTQTTMLNLARRIVDGDIEPRPYRLGTKTPCSRCDYRSVCKFDWQINRYRPVRGRTKAEVVGGGGT